MRSLHATHPKLAICIDSFIVRLSLLLAGPRVFRFFRASDPTVVIGIAAVSLGPAVVRRVPYSEFTRLPRASRLTWICAKSLRNSCIFSRCSICFPCSCNWRRFRVKYSLGVSPGSRSFDVMSAIIGPFLRRGQPPGGTAGPACGLFDAWDEKKYTTNAALFPLFTLGEIRISAPARPRYRDPARDRWAPEDCRCRGKKGAGMYSR